MSFSQKYEIAIVGIGGRVASLFAFELQKEAKILGIGKEKQIKDIKEKKFYIKRNKEKLKPLDTKVITEKEFSLDFLPEYIILATKNPVGKVIENYYQKIKTAKKLPALILPQNGLRAEKEAREILKKVFGKRAKEISILRISLLNAIESKKLNEKIIISYSLPVRLGICLCCGEKQTAEKFFLFLKKSKIKVKIFPQEKLKEMEISKLFLNLIGTACASRDLSLKEGFEKKEVFKEEIGVLKEYVKLVKKMKKNFLNLFYPIKIFAFLIEKLPFSFWWILRKPLLKIIEKGRNKKEKQNLDEIDYYNGEVVKLAREYKISVPFNEKVLERFKKKAGCQSG